MLLKSIWTNLVLLSEWILSHLCAKPSVIYEKPEVLSPYRILEVDGSTIMEKGALPKEWHLHYALDIFTLTRVLKYAHFSNTGLTAAE